MKILQIFISSPGDVFEERAIADRVIDRLQSEYAGRIVLEPVLWEHEPLVATANFQEQIVQPSDTDIVIAILWSRLGTRLPKGYVRQDGSRYESGTEYEFEEAIEGFRKNGKPDLLVYRKTAPPSVRLDDEKELMERLEQKKKLDAFVDKWFHDKSEGTLVAAFHAFVSPSDFEHLLETHLHKLIERQLPKSVAAVSDAPAIWKKGSPFRGLYAFDYEHAPVFFGRTKAVSDILQALRDQAADDRPFVLILGMSGGGKSSVVRAGVLPMLTRPGVMEGIGLWRRAVFRPTDVPDSLFTGLATALLREHGLPSLDTEGNGPAELAQVLRESPHAAVSLIRTALAQEAANAGGNVTSRLALVIDQMEEMFTQTDILPKHRKAFVDVLDTLARSGHVWILCTLRSDFYPRLANLPTLGALKEGAGQYDLMPPTSSEIGQMIRLPTRAAGLYFEEDPANSERLDDMLRDAAAEHPEVLPLLQFTLEELYQRRTADGMLTLAAYRDLGGVEGSLARRAETVFKDLPDDVEEQLPKVLNELVSIEHDGHGTIGRKRASWSDVSMGKSRELIETFVENRLFVTELGSDGNVVVTVAHEALLWHWPRVREWVDQNRENLRIRSRIAAAAERWEIENKRSDLLLPAGKPIGEAESLLEQDIELHDDEESFIHASIAKAKRIQRLKAGVVATLAILGMVAAWSSFVANQQRDLANQSRMRAEIDAKTAKQTTVFMVGLFEVSDPSEALGNTITAREILDQGARRIEFELVDQPAIQSTLLDTMGTVYMSLGLYDDARKLLGRGLDTRRHLYGEAHPAVARSQANLGELLGFQAEFEEAAVLYEQAIAIQREASDAAGAADVAQSMVGLAWVRTRQGDFEGAEELLREAVDIQRQVLGEENLTVAKSLDDLGMSLWDQGEYDAAEPLLRQALAMRRRVIPGGIHPDVDESLNNLAVFLYETGEFEQTEALFRESLTMKQRLRGDSHPEVAIGLNNLAFVQHDMGEHSDAEKNYQEALSIRRASLDEDHPLIAQSLNNLAFLYYDMGNRDRALELSSGALAIYREAYPGNHPDVAYGMQNLAGWLVAEGDYEAAEPLLREALEMNESLFDPGHPDIAITQTGMAILLLRTDRAAEAQTLAAEAHSTLGEAYEEDHWRTAWAGATLGASLTALSRYEEAETVLIRSYKDLRGNSGARAIHIDTTRQYMVDLYTRWGRPEEAARYTASAESRL